MHERALLDDLLREILAVAAREHADRVTRIEVRLGALSHFTPDHFREHFADAARGTVAEGASVVARLEGDLGDPHADGVRLVAVDVVPALPPQGFGGPAGGGAERAVGAGS